MLLRIFPVDDQHPADVLYRLGDGARADFGQEPVARRPVRPGDPDLDQLVALQRPIDLLQHASGQSRGAYNNDRAQRVGAGAELPSESGIHGRNGAQIVVETMGF